MANCVIAEAPASTDTADRAGWRGDGRLGIPLVLCLSPHHRFKAMGGAQELVKQQRKDAAALQDLWPRKDPCTCSSALGMPEASRQLGVGGKSRAEPRMRICLISVPNCCMKPQQGFGRDMSCLDLCRDRWQLPQCPARLPGRASFPLCYSHARESVVPCASFTHAPGGSHRPVPQLLMDALLHRMCSSSKVASWTGTFSSILVLNRARTQLDTVTSPSSHPLPTLS